MSEIIRKAKAFAIENKQEHLLAFFENMDLSSGELLASDLLSSDLLEELALFSEADGSAEDEEIKNVQGLISPTEVKVLKTLSEPQRKAYKKSGLELIKAGKVAALTMAGGQGSRLGYSGPKGSYILPTKPPKSFFQIQAQGLLRLAEMAGRQPIWLIMTSRENHDQSVDFFLHNEYFGLDRDKVFFFPQNQLPVTDLNGKLLVKNGRILKAADGNGGIFAALDSSGLLRQLGDQGVEKLFVCGIDNVLVKMADPYFIGFSLASDKAIVSKSVLKRSPDEKAGIFCRKDGRPFYLEYIEIPGDKAREVDENGDYIYGDIGIVSYVYNMDLLKKLSDKPLPYYAAIKKIAHDDPRGIEIQAGRANAKKLESFIFDSFEYVDDIGVLRVERDSEFLPVKNLTGEDSAQALEGFEFSG